MKIRKVKNGYSFKKGLNYNSVEIHEFYEADLEAGDDIDEVSQELFLKAKKKVMERVEKVKRQYEKANPDSKKLDDLP